MAKSKKTTGNNSPNSATGKATATATLKAGSQGKTSVPSKTGVQRKANSKPETLEIKMTLNHEQIAKRAFDIWVAKGRPQGQDHQNWQEAEQALVRDLAKRA